MSYKICATKRDVNTVGKPLQYFTPSQWMIRVSTGTNAGDYDISDTYLLIKNGEVTSLACNIPLINGCVYEGMLVLVGSGIKVSFGALLQKETANQCVTKLKVLDTNCNLTGESAEYTSNRLVREEDIVAPSIVMVYYDPRYLIVEEFKTDGISKYPMAAIDPGAPERTPGDELDPLMNREFAYSAILCTKGNKVKVTQKSTVNSDLILNSVYAYDNLSTPLYELNTPGYEGAEFIVTEKCFITFDLVAKEYRLAAAAPVIDCGTLWYFSIQATTSNNESDFLVNVGTDDPQRPVCRWNEDYIMVPNEDEVVLEVTLDTGTFSHTITSFVLRNLTTNETTPLSLDANNYSSFKMPSSDCQIETTVVVHEDSEDEELEYPTRTLTFIGSLFQTITVNDIVYTVQGGKVEDIQLSCGTSPHALAEIYYDAGIPAVYHVRAYPSDTGPTNMPRPLTTPNTTLSLSTDMTLEVSYSPISCEYKTIGGLISDLTKGKNWNSTSNTITNVLLSNGFYKLTTTNPVSTTPANFAFKNKELLEEVKFHTSNSSFLVLKDSFRECSSLHAVVLPDVNSLSIRNSAFYRCTNLSKLELPYGLNDLLTYVFPSNNYKAIYTSNEYTSTSQYADSLTFNVNSEYKSLLSVIPEGTFSTCSRLEEVYLPASITKIKSKAFRNCNNLKHFASPGLLVIELGAFEETWIEGTTSDSTELIEAGTTYGESNLYKKQGTTGVLFDIPGTNLGGLNKNYTMCTYISPMPDNTSLILYRCNDEQIGGSGAGRYTYSLHHKTISISPSAFSGNYDFGNIGCYSDINTGVSVDKLSYIGECAFKDNSRLTAFRFPKQGRVSYLGPYAFCNCKRLSEIFNFKLLPITKIEKYTFYKCGDNKYGIGGATDAGYNNLDFYIPDSITTIDSYAFADCPQLMTIANLATCNITSLGEGAFMNCFLNSTWKASTGKDIALLTAYLACSVLTMVCGGVFITNVGGGLLMTETGLIIKSGVSAAGGIIGSEIAGAGNGLAVALNTEDEGWTAKRNKTSEIFLSKVSVIGDKCFSGCTHLGKVVLNYQMNTIPYQAFANCKRLSAVLFSDGSFDAASTSPHICREPLVTSIGEEAFLNCKNLDSAELNILLRNVNTIKKNAFKGCTQTEEIILPASITTLEEGALGFDGRCIYAFESSVPPQNVSNKVFKNNTTKKCVYIKSGSKNAYIAKFPQVKPSEFIELPESDPYWNNLFS